MNIVGPTTFSRAMIRALHAGLKTQTRRLSKLQPAFVQPLSDGSFEGCPDGGFDQGVIKLHCPYGRVGDSRWIQEDYSLPDIGPLRKGRRTVACEYESDATRRLVELTVDETDKLDCRRTDKQRCQPGRFMYQSLSRSFFTLTAIRLERLQEITIEDAFAEGAMKDDNGRRTVWGYKHPIDDHWRQSPVDAYRHLWDSLHAEDPWESNPLVWVLDFTFKKQI